MFDKNSGRRNFLRSVGAAGLGVIGSIGASQTVAASKDKKVRIHSASADWDYQFFTDLQHEVHKGDKADSDDEITGGSYNNNVNGQVTEGDTDTYWLDSDDSISKFYIYLNKIEPTDFRVKFGSTSAQRTYIEFDRKNDDPSYPSFDYTAKTHGVFDRDDSLDGDEDVIREDNGDAELDGTIDAGDYDAAYYTQKPYRIYIVDPDHSYQGLEIELPN